MEITEVRVRLVQESSQDKLRAFVTMTFDNDFVVREVKVIEGDQGLFVAMPSRKAMERCRHCGGRNVVQAAYCNQCGKELPQTPPARGGRDKVYLDVAHPINAECRKQIHDAVVAAYEEELRSESGSEPRPARSRQEDGADDEPEDDEVPPNDEEEVEEEVVEEESSEDETAAVGSGDDDEQEDFDKGIFA